VPDRTTFLLGFGVGLIDVGDAAEQSQNLFSGEGTGEVRGRGRGGKERESGRGMMGCQGSGGRRRGEG
jgi:hypothetical protein